jgi:hypothetical protein
MIAENMLGDEDGIPRTEDTLLFLPSSLPVHICSLSEMKPICEVEKRLRVAAADDALAKI